MKHLHALLFAIIALTARTQSSAHRFALDPLGVGQHFLRSYKSGLHSAQQPFIPSLDKEWQAIDSLTKDSAYFSISPSALLYGGGSAGTAELGNWALAPGLETRYAPGNRWSLGALYRYYRERPQDYLSEFADSLRILPGIGYAIRDEFGYGAHYWEGQAGYQAGKYFHLEAGKGKHFWGDGYRSVLLSHNAAPYPYFRITTKIWKIRYVNLFSMLSDISSGRKFSDRRQKFTSMHAISWNLHPRINVSVYEMVIWQARDTLSNRGFELSYLNPVIFYRPLEYAQGSADNVLLGLSVCGKITEQQQVYASTMLDEFLIDEVQNKLGWWGTKYGLQAGFKSFDTFIPGLHFQLEYNKARPFTYTHGSVLQNYGHLNQSLAHPIGTNFREIVFLSRYSSGKWSFLLSALWVEFGRDIGQDNYGGNIFRSYVNPFRKFGNEIAQGDFNRLNMERLEASYDLGVHGLRAYGELGARQLNTSGRIKNEAWFTLGIRSNLIPTLRDL
jgi:hypothetical protein